jgi:hypothetical protein
VLFSKPRISATLRLKTLPLPWQGELGPKHREVREGKKGFIFFPKLIWQELLEKITLCGDDINRNYVPAG